ncbi:hypothetical protein BMR1_03g00535 [Babesia microti strain RI]|uniref:Uncharacterized protein n=1 Tax=Babesia microti (strain RI) TaxID=1133968 RepID=A0A0K3AMB7_BABMR|nr:hypothetical protein BMR1_03g00535 [Babesia microti strain RI]CTQ40707.1 hypothetical protein BMR1_03g00535 [Babesia microti strain RI]|eukprot:XP_012648718.1 hypothetical protein BMR1_03g00535 [Babesia microti strain RI]
MPLNTLHSVGSYKFYKLTANVCILTSLVVTPLSVENLHLAAVGRWRCNWGHHFSSSIRFPP